MTDLPPADQDRIGRTKWELKLPYVAPTTDEHHLHNMRRLEQWGNDLPIFAGGGVGGYGLISWAETAGVYSQSNTDPALLGTWASTTPTQSQWLGVTPATYASGVITVHQTGCYRLNWNGWIGADTFDNAFTIGASFLTTRGLVGEYSATPETVPSVEEWQSWCNLHGVIGLAEGDTITVQFTSDYFLAGNTGFVNTRSTELTVEYVCPAIPGPEYGGGD